jgi:hypothetical protein
MTASNGDPEPTRQKGDPESPQHAGKLRSVLAWLKWFGGDGPKGFTREVLVVGTLWVGFFTFASGFIGWSLSTNFHEFLRISLSALMISLAAGCAGSTIGFIFGVPRKLQDMGTHPEPGRPRYLDNTNFEQVSDWLTKIIVGVSLVQIGKLPSALGQLGHALAPLLGWFAPNDRHTPVAGESAIGGIGVAMCLTAALAAFFLGYIWTRVTFTRLLAQYSADDNEEISVAFHPSLPQQ